MNCYEKNVRDQDDCIMNCYEKNVRDQEDCIMNCYEKNVRDQDDCIMYILWIELWVHTDPNCYEKLKALKGCNALNLNLPR